MQERSSEEARLHDAWSNAGTALREDPGSDDDRTLVNQPTGQRNHQQDDQAVKVNGGMAGDGEDSDMQDADVEEDMDDDDMMDKISSSPSIDDGGYLLPCYPVTWPARHESLTPQSSPMLSTVASSSPFTNTPIHFPISVADACRPGSVPARDVFSISDPVKSSFPTSFQNFQQNNTLSTEHHHGEYAWIRTTDVPAPDSNDPELEMSPRSKRLSIVERRLEAMRDDSQASLTSELDEHQVNSMLQPIYGNTPHEADDPLVEPIGSPPRTSNGTPPSPKADHLDDEDDSWTTDSDADSWEDYQDDDASRDVSFSDDSRFVDSGWGGECLRETEDIDFEFVYALHTFIATVEGQANATKGDTMVLLDDSNSYWWLVRVVKDSSIGRCCATIA